MLGSSIGFGSSIGPNPFLLSSSSDLQYPPRQMDDPARRVEDQGAQLYHANGLPGGFDEEIVKPAPQPVGSVPQLSSYMYEYLALVKAFLEVANSVGAADFVEHLSFWKERLGEIWATECITEDMHQACSMLPFYLKHAQNWKQLLDLNPDLARVAPRQFDQAIFARHTVLEPVLAEYLALEQDFLKVTTSPQAANFLDRFLRLQERLDKIWGTEYITNAQDMHILMHQAHVMLPVYTKQAQNWERCLHGGELTDPVSIFLIESPVPHAPAKSKTGPWVFKLLVAPGFNLNPDEPVVVTVSSVKSKYDVNTKRLALPKLSEQPSLTRCPDNDEFLIENLSFDSASDARPFQVEFNFAVCLQGYSEPLPYFVYSLPFTALSNATQWEIGERHYVAYHAFGGTRGTLSQVSYAAFFNALQFEYLTSTRQMVSEGYLRRLKAKHDTAKQELRTSRPNSKTSAGHHLTIALYENYIHGHRFVRPLTLDEVTAIFPPTPVGTKWVMNRNTFLEIWQGWYGDFAYRLFTGQNAGDEPRRLFLDGLIHFTPKGSQDVAILDPAFYLPGTALIRPSSAPGQFTFNTIITKNGEPDITFKRLQAQRSGFSTDVKNEAYIQWLVNIQGLCISSAAFIANYTPKSAAANKNGRYRDSIGDIVQVQALHNYAGQRPEELSFVAGDWITVRERDDSGWWKGEINGLIGYFPTNLVRQ